MFSKTWKSMRANVLIGIFLVVPILATVLIFDFLFSFLIKLVPLGKIGRLSELDQRLLGLLTLLVILSALYLVGLLTRNIAGRKLYELGDRILARIPLINGIYRSLRQISASIFVQRQTLFKEIVLIEYPRKGIFTIAFVTAEASAKVSAACCCENCDDKNPMLCLFVPTTPNPTSGVFVMTPRAETYPLKIPISDAITSVMSAGAVAPGESISEEHSLLKKLHDWARVHIEESNPSKDLQKTKDGNKDPSNEASG